MTKDITYFCEIVFRTPIYMEGAICEYEEKLVHESEIKNLEQIVKQVELMVRKSRVLEQKRGKDTEIIFKAFVELGAEPVFSCFINNNGQVEGDDGGGWEAVTEEASDPPLKTKSKIDVAKEVAELKDKFGIDLDAIKIPSEKNKKKPK